VVDPSAPKVYEFTVDVQQQLVTEVRAVPPVQWMLTESDYSRADSMMRASPRLREALRRRGLTVDSIAVETWASGVPVPQASRFARCLFYALDAEGVNRYDRPVEGVSALIDLTSGTILQWMNLNRVKFHRSHHATILRRQSTMAHSLPQHVHQLL
jgi:Cu2+-containing amine oxidase